MPKTYEIWNVDTHEVLVDNLTFDEVAEQFPAYQQFYNVPIIACYQEHNDAPKHTITRAEEYRNTWMHYLGELYSMGNI